MEDRGMCVGRKYIDRPNEIRSRLSSALYGVICPIFRTRSLSLSLFFQKAKTRTDKYIYRPDVLREREREKQFFFSFFILAKRKKIQSHGGGVFELSLKNGVYTPRAIKKKKISAGFFLK